MYKLINVLIIYIKQTFRHINTLLTSKMCNKGYGKHGNKWGKKLAVATSESSLHSL
jgi:hypothetical protein